MKVFFKPLISVAFCSLIFLSTNAQKGFAELQRQNDSLRLEIRLNEITGEYSNRLSDLHNELEKQKDIVSESKSATDRWITFIEVFFSVIGVIIGLLAFFGFRQIKQYTDIAKRDQRELETIVNKSRKDATAIKTRQEELQKFKPEEALTEQNKLLLQNTIDEARSKLAVAGFDALKNLYQAKAITAYDKKDWNATIRFSENYLDFDEMNADMWHRWAFSQTELGYEEKAIEGYDKAILFNPRLAKSYYNLGILHQRKNNNDVALDSYNKAIELDNKAASSYGGRGVLYFNQKNYEAALADYNKAIELDNKDAGSYVRRGVLYFNQKNYEAALADYNKAIELDNKAASSYGGRGLLYFDQKNYEMALADYNKAIELNNKDAYSYCNRGVLYFNQKNYEAALADYNRAIELDNKLSLMYWNRYLLFNEIEKIDNSIDDIKRALELEPENEIYKAAFEVSKKRISKQSD
ncbi:MAG TPA: tetratricopeptide repeat protein [Chitinophagaceae bacterium]|nr:tetratricopeptide repeat protein [Chitinophagaceae bacterium]